MPFVLNVEWADREATEEQLDVIYDLLNDLTAPAGGIGTPTSNKVDIDGNDIESIEQWLADAIKSKAKECKAQLKSPDEKGTLHTDKTLAELDGELNALKEKERQSDELVEAYEGQIPDQTKE